MQLTMIDREAGDMTQRMVDYSFMFNVQIYLINQILFYFWRTKRSSKSTVSWDNFVHKAERGRFDYVPTARSTLYDMADDRTRHRNKTIVNASQS